MDNVKNVIIIYIWEITVTRSKCIVLSIAGI